MFTEDVIEMIEKILEKPKEDPKKQDFIEKLEEIVDYKIVDVYLTKPVEDYSESLKILTISAILEDGKEIEMVFYQQVHDLEKPILH